MGRAIDMENRQDALELRLKLVEDALEELVQTRVHHVDLHDEMDKHEERIRTENSDTRNVKTMGVELKPDEEYTAPVGKRKKTTRKVKATATT